jgi:hypothetical protein
MLGSAAVASIAESDQEDCAGDHGVRSRERNAFNTDEHEHDRGAQQAAVSVPVDHRPEHHG